jgi:uncharacterized protein
MSQPLMEEFTAVWNRPRLRKRIDVTQADRLERQIKERAIWIDIKTIPPHCRDPKDLPVLATAIDGNAAVIVSGDDDLRADSELRTAMEIYGIRLLGVNSFLEFLHYNGLQP